MKNETTNMKQDEENICQVLIEEQFTKDGKIYRSRMFCKNPQRAERYIKNLKKEDKYVVGVWIEIIDDEKELERIRDNYIWESPCHQH